MASHAARILIISSRVYGSTSLRFQVRGVRIRWPPDFRGPFRVHAELKELAQDLEVSRIQVRARRSPRGAQPVEVLQELRSQVRTSSIRETSATVAGSVRPSDNSLRACPARSSWLAGTPGGFSQRLGWFAVASGHPAPPGGRTARCQSRMPIDWRISWPSESRTPSPRSGRRISLGSRPRRGTGITSVCRRYSSNAMLRLALRRALLRPRLDRPRPSWRAPCRPPIHLLGPFSSLFGRRGLTRRLPPVLPPLRPICFAYLANHLCIHLSA